MEKITELLDKFKDIEKLIPKMDKLVEWAHWLMSIAVRIGPLCILFLGVIYLLIPPKEANRKFGFRTYFGMGSVEAWLFTQRTAGIIMTIAGLILHKAAKSASKKFAGMAITAVAEEAFEIFKGQVKWILFIYVFMFLITMIGYNSKGLCRFRKLRQNPASTVKRVKNIIEKEPVEEISQAEEMDVLPEDADYEYQGEQVITADDIVIEGLDE